jgi:outer membrane protein assembly factor BamB
VADGRVFVLDYLPDQGQKKPGSGFRKDRMAGVERVVCLGEKTGDELWKHEYPCSYQIQYPGGPRCTPSVDGDRVYTLGAMGDLYCLDVKSGKPLWSHNFMKEYGAETQLWGFAGHPLVDGDRLICLAGGTEGRMVMAFDKMTGAVRWAALKHGGEFGYCPPVIYDLAGVRTLVIWHPWAVVGLDPVTGRTLWEQKFNQVVRSALTVPMPRQVGPDEVFVTSFYNGSMRVKAAPGGQGVAVVWKGKGKGERPNLTSDLHSIMPTPFVEGDHIYGVCSYGQLRCIKAGTGERVWETMKATRGALTDAKVAASDEPSNGERWSNAFLVKNGDRYFLFNEQGELIIARLTPKGYEEIDRAKVLKPTNMMAGRPVVWMHPAFANGCMVARNDEEIVRVSLEK